MNKKIAIHTLCEIIKNKHVKFSIVHKLKQYGYDIILNSGYTRPGTVTDKDIEIINAVVNIYCDE